MGDLRRGRGVGDVQEIGRIRGFDRPARCCSLWVKPPREQLNCIHTSFERNHALTMLMNSYTNEVSLLSERNQTINHRRMRSSVTNIRITCLDSSVQSYFADI